ncbi:GntR family transcriptional regulator [Flavobacterium sp. NG2]|uniref:GntR family transcriptional regulator n=1 Tax=Flavobacterium sp. NG2 TaxID=3097547 RepID=UPI002A8016AD|nr:GntR family transcriptional regulator [Flavobacterium sp. NG2]WPR70091.1 GntR family transcriptional regulator [Flavobacterium sp. NG2]
MDFSKNIIIDEESRVPKYRQIVEAVIHNISNGKIRVNEKIPSINFFSEEFGLSRDTVERAYNILKERKIITSIRGKGYYITRTDLISKINVLFLVNKLSSYKMIMYNEFINSIGPSAHVDLHIYHCDESLFLNLLEKFKSAYDYYVIMPHFKTEDLKHISYTPQVLETLKEIPSEKLILMDNNNMNIGNGVAEIYQDFEEDIYNGLKEGLEKILKYSKLILVYPEKSVYPYPRRILHGFRKFCVEFNIDFQVINEVCADIVLKKGDLFITIAETDLVILINQIRNEEFVLGNDIGVISYNDSPLKDLLGISVLSTDFVFIGKRTANMILNHEKDKIRAPFRFIDRNSI